MDACGGIEILIQLNIAASVNVCPLPLGSRNHPHGSQLGPRAQPLRLMIADSALHGPQPSGTTRADAYSHYSCHIKCKSCDSKCLDDAHSVSLYCYLDFSSPQTRVTIALVKRLDDAHSCYPYFSSPVSSLHTSFSSPCLQWRHPEVTPPHSMPHQAHATALHEFYLASTA